MSATHANVTTHAISANSAPEERRAVIIALVMVLAGMIVLLGGVLAMATPETPAEQAIILPI